MKLKTAIALLWFTLLVLGNCQTVPPEILQRQVKAAMTIPMNQAAGTGPVLYPAWNNVFMAASNTPNPIIVMGDTDSASDFPAWHAFDNSIGAAPAFWQAGTLGSFPHYITYNSGAGINNILVQLAMIQYVNFGPSNFTLLGSTDGSTWIGLFTNTMVNDENLIQTFTNPVPSAYQYYRISASNSYNATYVIIREAYLSSGWPIPNLSGYTSGSITVSADSEFSATYRAWKAFDGDKALSTTRASQWVSATTSFPHWLKVDLGRPENVSRYQLWQDVVNTGINAFTFDGSQDDNAWTTIQTTNALNVIAPQWFGNGNTNSYRYYRLNITSGYGAAAQIAEWRIFRNQSAADTGSPLAKWSPTSNTNSAGDWLDSVGNYTLTQVGVLASNTVPPCRSFQGTTSSYMTAGNVLTGSSTLAISVWLYSTNIALDQVVVARWPGAVGEYILYIGQDVKNGKLQFNIHQSNGTLISSPASAQMVNNTWYHVCGVADGSKVRLYTNGVEVASGTTYNGTMSAGSATNFVVGLHDARVYAFGGGMGDISVFSNLTATQVWNLYTAGRQ